ncbi:MAG TPA: methyltransferase domain-containing protein [Candidatus Saccharimonadales bacterium]|nr:methyltransferase domain-containing protein [Candidatus Saccharimonadales bacterium]
MAVEDRVRDHFHADAERFDAIYADAKSPLARLVDGVWRGVVRRRFGLTLQLLGRLEGQTILDVGCGSGRYGIEFARRGAARVVGLDFAPAMIERARQLARGVGVADRCEFRIGAFPADVPPGRYDACTAMGFFDYVPNAAELIRHMRSMTSGTLVMSFPKAREWRVPLRRLRFLLLGCPLFLYSEARLRRLLEEAGVRDYRWIPLDRDYIVAAP